MTYEPTPDDRLLEAMIETEYLKLQAAKRSDERRCIWERFKYLKAQRSKGMVRYLEEQKGIAG